MDPRNMLVRITITPNGRIPTEPMGSQYEEVRTFTVPIKADGGYSTVITGPSGEGSYSVKATASDGKGTDNTSFFVMDKDEMESEVMFGVEKAIRLATDAVADADKMIESLPESPAKVDMVKKVTAIKAKIAEGPS